MKIKSKEIVQQQKSLSWTGLERLERRPLNRENTGSNPRAAVSKLLAISPHVAIVHSAV